MAKRRNYGMMRNMKRLSLAVACLGAALNALAISTSSYVQRGLVACWDGVENAGAGVHDSGATVWKDVVGGYEFTLTNVSVNADNMTFAGNEFSYGILSAAAAAETFDAAKNGTLEIVYVSRNSGANQVMLQGPADNKMAFGYNSVKAIVAVTGSSGNGLFSFTQTASQFYSFSVRFTSGAPVSARANGAALNSPSGGYWSPGERDEAFVGINARKTCPFPGSIYCIRLYNRQLSSAEIAANLSIDQVRFMLDKNSILMVSSKPVAKGSPSPAYGLVTNLSADDTREVSCGAAVFTNAAATAEYRCTGWKLYNFDDNVVSNGSETSFTYIHPTPAVFRRLEWQWEVNRLADFSGYVQDGLVACWDGIGNAGVGVHADNAAVWKDVIGGYEFVLTNVTVGADNMTFAGTATSYGTLSAAGTAATFDAAKDGTLEIVYLTRNKNDPQVMLQTPADNGMTFGYSASAGSIIPYSGSSKKPLFLFTQTVSEMCSVAVRFTSGAPVSARANGATLNSPDGGYWTPGDGGETFVGSNALKTRPFPGSIYCIRLYDRKLTDEEISANYALDTKRFSNGDVPESTLVVSGTPEGIGAPSPGYGFVTELSAGDNRVVSCGAIPWKDATGTNRYTCTGWKLYDSNGALVGSGSGTSFTYTHPTPAEYRRLEWQWVSFSGIGTVIRLF